MSYSGSSNHKRKYEEENWDEPESAAPPEKKDGQTVTLISSDDEVEAKDSYKKPDYSYRESYSRHGNHHHEKSHHLSSHSNSSTKSFSVRHDRADREKNHDYRSKPPHHIEEDWDAPSKASPKNSSSKAYRDTDKANDDHRTTSASRHFSHKIEDENWDDEPRGYTGRFSGGQVNPVTSIRKSFNEPYRSSKEVIEEENWDEEVTKQSSSHVDTIKSFDNNKQNNNPPNRQNCWDSYKKQDSRQANIVEENWDEEQPKLSPKCKDTDLTNKNFDEFDRSIPKSSSLTTSVGFSHTNAVGNVEMEVWDDEEPKIPVRPSSPPKKSDEVEDWDSSGDDDHDHSKKSLKHMSEREREEEIFRRIQEKETEETRRKIVKSLKRRGSEMELGELEDSFGEEVSVDRENCLKVSDIFGDLEDDLSPARIEPEDPAISNVEQLESIRLDRTQLERWLYMPFFEDRIPGFFVRVNIGTKNDAPLYRIAQIVGVRTQEHGYTVDKIRTNKILRLSICKQERSFRMSYVSNQSFTADEFKKWVEEYHKANEPLPLVSELNEKQEDYKYCSNYVVTDVDISKIVKEKQRFMEIPQNYAILKKQIVNEMEHAKINNDFKKIAELQPKLDDVNKVLAKLSESYRLKNEKAPLMTEEQRIEELNLRERLVQEEMKADRNKGNDPFTRRRTAPSLIQFVNSSTLKEEARERLIKLRTATFKIDSGPPPESDADAKRKVIPEPAPPPDMKSLHDFDLDLDLNI